MERRAHVRQTTDFEVVISSNSIQNQRCRVKDFCIGGMLLSWEEQGSNLSQLVRNDPIQVTVNIPTHINSSSRQYSLQAKAARVSGNNMGVAFVHPDSQALASIQQLAQSTAPKANIKNDSGLATHASQENPHFDGNARRKAKEKYSDAQVRDILKSCLSDIEYFCDSKIDEYFGALNETLQEALDTAKSNAEQNLLFDELNKYRKSENGVKQKIKADIPVPFADFTHQGNFDLAFLRKDSGDSKIGLIDKDEFEDWLVVKVMASKVETDFHEMLLEFQLRLEELCGVRPGVQNNPISPAVICNAFNEAMSRLPLDTSMKKIIYRVFETEVVANLDKLYAQLNQSMSDAGILRDIDVVEHMARNNPILNSNAANSKPEPEQSDEIEQSREVAGHNSQPVDTNFESTEQGLPQNNMAGGTPNHAPRSARYQAVNDLGALQNNVEFSPQALKVALQKSSSYQAANPAQATNEVSSITEPTNSNGVQAADAQEYLTSGSGNAPYAGTNPLGFSNKGFSAQAQVARNAVTTAKQLISNYRDSSSPIFDQQSFDESIPVVEPNVLSSKLTIMQQAGGIEDGRSLSERVYQELKEGDEEQRLESSDSAALNVIERLFESILDLDNVDEQTQKWLRHLEIPFLRLLMKDEAFLQNIDHPARLVVNTIAKLGQSGVIKNKQNADKVTEVVKKVSEEFEDDISAFNSANHELKALQERQERIYQKNVERVLDAAKGQNQKKSSKRYVDQVLEGALSGKTVPKAIVTLLDAGWRELLNLTSIRFGNESELFKEYESVIYKLLQAGEPGAAKPDLRALLTSIKTGLNTVSTGGDFNDERTLSELKDLLMNAGKDTISSVPTVDLPLGIYDSSINNEPVNANDIWLRRAKKIQVGDWLEVDASAEIFSSNSEAQTNEEGEILEKIHMRLAWVDLSGDELLFVNHQGMKIVDIDARILADLLRQGKAVRIEDQDQPIVNLGLDKMVHKFYEQLVDYASRDNDSGLINLKEFKKQIKKYLKLTRKTHRPHALVHIDIDVEEQKEELRLQLIQNIASSMRANTPDNAQLARTDETSFGVFFVQATDKQANTHIKKLSSALDKIANDETLGQPSFHLGIAYINQFSSDADALLNGVMLASQQAKEQDLAQSVSDRGPTHHAKTIDIGDLVKRGLFQLSCQKIKPLEHSEESARYEILLSLQGDEYRLRDVIQNAEMDDKMRIIDRWVIKNIFEWIHHSPDKAALINNIGINLSPDSLNDESLLYYIFENFVNLDQIPRDKICFEVSESTAVSNIDDLADFIQEMQNIGCQFSLDDFGSEARSYNFLKNLPLDYIKIDGDFIKDIAYDDTSFAMVKSINEMIHFMGKKTIAKQVDRPELLSKLHEIGVDFVQGDAVEASRSISAI